MPLSSHQSLREKFDDLREILESNIIGQSPAIDTIVSVLERYAAGLHDHRRPIGSFLFLGPTGVGKTFSIEKLAEIVQPKDGFVKIDCSEFSLDHEVAKLLGAPPGYLGHESGSVLTNALKAIKNPESGFILLLDEVEKAHPKFFDIWLQILDAGVFTDGKGNKLDFTRALVFMTSNVGADKYGKHQLIGFRETSKHVNITSLIETDLKRVFRPEFLNRLSGKVFFSTLNRDQQSTIFNNLIGDLNARLAPYSIRVTIEPEYREKLFNQGFSDLYGARELRRVLVNELEQPLARKIIRDDVVPDSLIQIGMGENPGEITVSRIGSYPILAQVA